MCMMLVMLPFFMLAMYEKHGQPWKRSWAISSRWPSSGPRSARIRPNNFYAVLERQEKLDKEVYDIVHGNQKLAAPAVRKRRKDRAAG